MPDAITIYKFFNVADDLLYVGITGRGPRRWVEHGATQPWWGDVARVEVEHEADRRRAVERERELIREYHPKHNVVHNGKSKIVPMPHATERQDAPTGDPPVGWWFHSYEPIRDGEYELTTPWTSTKTFGGVECIRAWQGQIRARIGDSRFLCQLYSWWDGVATEAQVVEESELERWVLYPTNEDMLMAGGCDELVDRGPRGERRRCGVQKVGYVDVPVLGRHYLCSSCMDHYSGQRVVL
jgi:hypothetical protein